MLWIVSRFLTPAAYKQLGRVRAPSQAAGRLAEPEEAHRLIDSGAGNLEEEDCAVLPCRSQHATIW